MLDVDLCSREPCINTIGGTFLAAAAAFPECVARAGSLVRAGLLEGISFEKCASRMRRRSMALMVVVFRDFDFWTAFWGAYVSRASIFLYVSNVKGEQPSIPDYSFEVK